MKLATMPRMWRLRTVFWNGSEEGMAGSGTQTGIRSNSMNRSCQMILAGRNEEADMVATQKKLR
jgi:hypothetical protein